MIGTRMTTSERIFQILSHIIVILVGLACIVPFLFVISASVTPMSVLLEKGGYVMIPPEINFYAYQYSLQTSLLLDALLISVARVLVGTGFSLLINSMAGYALSKSYLKGRKFFIQLLIISFLFGPGLIPYYVVCRTLHLVNRFWMYVIPGAAGAWTIFIFRQFFMGLPIELEEAARLDGANEWQILSRVVLPLSTPVFAALGLFSAVGHWNDFMTSVIYVRDPKLHPVAMVLQRLLVFNPAVGGSVGGSFVEKEMAEKLSAMPAQSVKMANVVLATIPILIVYPFLQKYFAKGMLTGAIKG